MFLFLFLSLFLFLFWGISSACHVGSTRLEPGVLPLPSGTPGALAQVLDQRHTNISKGLLALRFETSRDIFSRGCPAKPKAKIASKATILKNLFLLYPGPPPTYETARFLIANAFEQNGLNYSNQLSTYTQRFLSKFGVVSAQKSCKHDSVMKQFCVKLEKAPPSKILNLSSLGKKSANDGRCEALYQMLLKKFEKLVCTKRAFVSVFGKKSYGNRFAKGSNTIFSVKNARNTDYLQIGAKVSKTLDGSISQKCCS